MQPNLFQAVKRFINIRSVGSTYTSSELCNYTKGTECVTFWKARNNNPSYRTRTYQTYLKRLGFLTNVRRGIWKITAHVPDWLDSGHVNAALGYKREWDYENRCIKDSLYKGMTTAEIQAEIAAAVGGQAFAANQPEETTSENKVNDGLAVFMSDDPCRTCIELRRIGVLAVPLSRNEVDVHIIDKRSAEALAMWMLDNDHDLNDYPAFEDLLRVYWPRPEMPAEERKTCTVAVLDYSSGKVEIVQGVWADDAEQFIEDNYSGRTIEWMTMDTLQLNVTQAY